MKCEIKTGEVQTTDCKARSMAFKKEQSFEYCDEESNFNNKSIISKRLGVFSNSLSSVIARINPQKLYRREERDECRRSI